MRKVEEGGREEDLCHGAQNLGSRVAASLRSRTPCVDAKLGQIKVKLIL
jgi:hypothetical protein